MHTWWAYFTLAKSLPEQKFCIQAYFWACKITVYKIYIPRFDHWNLFFIFRFVSSSVYYGLNFNTSNLAGNLHLNVFISGLVEIPALVYVVALNNRFGRRKITLSLMLLAGISCLAVLVINLIGKWYSCIHAFTYKYLPTYNVPKTHGMYKSIHHCCHTFFIAFDAWILHLN